MDYLVDLNRNSVDVQNNDDLFNLILEQRFKINELLKEINTLRQSINQLQSGEITY